MNNWTPNPSDKYDEEAVAEHLPAFLGVFDEIKRPGDFAYNDDFRGRIPGIAGEHEDTAIYLLQGLRRKREMQRRVAELIADGFTVLERLDGITRFARVVLWPTRRMGGEWAEYESARVVPIEDGKPAYVIPKGKRTRGYLVSGRTVLVHV